MLALRLINFLIFSLRTSSSFIKVAIRLSLSGGGLKNSSLTSEICDFIFFTFGFAIVARYSWKVNTCSSGFFLDYKERPLPVATIVSVFSVEIFLTKELLND